MSLRGQAAIVGVGELPPRRESPGEVPLGLLARSGMAAIADAGLSIGDIDGLLVPQISGLTQFVPSAVAEYLGLRPTYAELVDLGGATGAGMVWRAAAAIAAGMCTSCLCVTSASRNTHPRSATPSKKTDSRTASKGTSRDRSAAAEFDAPYGLVGATAGYALIAARYEHEYGKVDGPRARIAVHQRDNACANPSALFHGKPITPSDVLDSELICDPLHKLEIVMPAAGAAAVVVTKADRAPDLRHPPAWLLGAGEFLTHASITSAPSLTDTAVGVAADRAFAMAGVQRSEVGLASVYDCYTITVLLTLEDAGFCSKGDGGDFVESHDLRWSGDFPVNTHGGQLSFGQAGIAGGMSHVTEAVLQVQGRAVGRQISGPRLAYINGNGGIMSEQVGLLVGASR